MSETLEFVRGDTMKFTVTCTRPDADDVQQPIDLTGASLWCTVKRDLDDPDEDAFIALESPFSVDRGISILNQTTNRGQAQVVGAAEQTADAVRGVVYEFDVQVVEATSEVSTPVTGRMIFRPDVTRATS